MYGLRLLVLDGGYSTVEPPFSSDPIPRSWQAVKELQTDAACQIVLICGTTFTKKQKKGVVETFPDWTIKYKSNACDGNLALVDPAAAHVVDSVLLGLGERPQLQAHQWELSQKRKAHQLELALKDGTQLCIVFTKFHHGTASSGLQFNITQREVCWNAVLDVMNSRDGPWVLCGSLGARGAPMAMVCQRHWHQKLQDFLGPGTRDHRRLSAITGGLEASKFDMESSALILQLASSGDVAPSASASASASIAETNRSDERPEKRSRVDIAMETESSKAALFLRNLGAVQTGPADAVYDLLCQNRGSNRNRKNSITYTDDGYVLTTPSTMQEKMACVEVVLRTLAEARSQGARCEAGPLNESQKTAAYNWLKDRWLEKWSTNDKLRREYRDVLAGRIVSPKKKRDIKSLRYKAFNAWLQQFVGDVHVARIMLNQGFATHDELRGLLVEVQEYYNGGEYAKRLDEARRKAAERATLKEAAQRARSAYKAAARIDRKIAGGEWRYEELSWEQVRLLDDLWKLKNAMETANKAYGFGLGSESSGSSIASVVFNEYYTRDLKKYFAGEDGQ